MDQQIDLSVLIPAREEEWLDLTIQDVLKNSEANTEIIAILDGYTPATLTPDPRVFLIYNPISKGQRAAANQGARLARGKYLMKLDAHCALDKGFDRKMLEAFEKLGDDDVTMIPVLRNLHVFDWVCPNGHNRYQGKDDVCKECGQKMTKKVLWFPKPSPARFTFTFDRTMHFQYWGDLAKRPENVRGVLLKDGTYDTNLRETMSIQGSCFMLTKKRYFELDICSETFHSWGQQGVEVACKTWLGPRNGRVISNLNTWYAHMFRTNQFGGFPYSNPQSKVDENREISRELFQRDKWPQATKKFQWLLDKFNPPEWTSVKGIIYYTDNCTDEKIANLVIDQLLRISQENSILITTAAMKKKMTFGQKNIYFPSLKIRGVLSQAKQILGALENSSADIVYFCEADVLYHPSHFAFIPPKVDTYYYNTNVWKVRWSDGHAVKVNDLKQLSGLVAYRDHMIRHYRKKIEIIEQRQKDILAAGEELHNEGVSKYMGYEPGMHSEPRGVDDFPVESFNSEFPLIDIRHDNNLTKNRWSKEEFKNQEQTIGWTETSADRIPGWEEYFTKIKQEGLLSKGMIFYTDNELDEKIARPVRDQLQRISQEKNIPIVSASLRRMNFGVKNIRFPSLKRGYEALFKQILGALENSKADIIFFTEHDVLYHPSHFDFTPPDKNTFYYNQNVWYVRLEDGFAMHYDVNQLSGLCGYREALITHFRERFARIEKEGFTRNMGFEPFTHNRIQWQSIFFVDTWKSPFPNIDIRYGANSTGMRWKQEEYRNQQLLINWIESDVTQLEGWDFTTLLTPVAP